MYLSQFRHYRTPIWISFFWILFFIYSIGSYATAAPDALSFNLKLHLQLKKGSQLINVLEIVVHFAVVVDYNILWILLEVLIAWCSILTTQTSFHQRVIIIIIFKITSSSKKLSLPYWHHCQTFSLLPDFLLAQCINKLCFLRSKILKPRNTTILAIYLFNRSFFRHFSKTNILFSSLRSFIKIAS